MKNLLNNDKIFLTIIIAGISVILINLIIIIYLLTILVSNTWTL